MNIHVSSSAGSFGFAACMAGYAAATHSDEGSRVVLLLIGGTEGLDLCLEVAVPRVTGEDQLHEGKGGRNEC